MLICTHVYVYQRKGFEILVVFKVVKVKVHGGRNRGATRNKDIEHVLSGKIIIKN